MIRDFLLLIFLAGVGLFGAWLAQNSGTVTMLWFDYRIETSVVFLLSAVFFAALFIVCILQLMFAPKRFFERRKTRKLQEGISELTYSVAALAASDAASAEAHSRKLEKLLGKTPLTILLSAQIAKSKGNEAETNYLLAQLLQYKETNYLAARSLSEIESKQENLHKALELAGQAHSQNQLDRGAILHVVGIQARMKKWNEAKSFVQKSKLARAEKKRIQALINIEQGGEFLDKGNDAEALPLAHFAIYHLPYFAPAAAFAATAYHENNSTSKAIRILKRAWRHSPNPLLLETLEKVILHLPAKKQEKIRDKLIGTEASGNWECKFCGQEHEEWHIDCNKCHCFDCVEWKAKETLL